MRQRLNLVGLSSHHQYYLAGTYYYDLSASSVEVLHKQFSDLQKTGKLIFLQHNYRYMDICFVWQKVEDTLICPEALQWLLASDREPFGVFQTYSFLGETYGLLNVPHTSPLIDFLSDGSFESVQVNTFIRVIMPRETLDFSAPMPKWLSIHIVDPLPANHSREEFEAQMGALEEQGPAAVMNHICQVIDRFDPDQFHAANEEVNKCLENINNALTLYQFILAASEAHWQYAALALRFRIYHSYSDAWPLVVRIPVEHLHIYAADIRNLVNEFCPIPDLSAYPEHVAAIDAIRANAS